ncbi:MAG: cytochrome c biogenesis protein ResB [Bacillota bacterium]|nr:cytochrome c biogenesis protein ResB [Bacillota bacterium]
MSICHFLTSRHLALVLLLLLSGVAGVEVALGLEERGLNVYGSGWFLALGLLLLANLLACTVQRLWRRVRARRADAPGWETYLGGRAERSGRPAAPRRWLNRGEAILLGSLLFHLGLAAVLVGALYDQLTLWRGSLFLTEGQALSLESDGRAGRRTAPGRTGEEEGGPWRGVRRGPWGRPDLAGVSLRLNALHLAYYQDGSLRELRADLAFRDVRTWWRGEVPAALRVNYPLYYRGVKFILRNYGFAPRFTLSVSSVPAAVVTPVGLAVQAVRPGPAVQLLFDGYVNLDFYAHGPGSEDGFRAGEGLVVRARFYPDWRGEKGKPLSSTTELRNPRFWLRVEEARAEGVAPTSAEKVGEARPQRSPGRAGGDKEAVDGGDGSSILYAGWVRPGEAVRFARAGARYELVIPDLRYWVQLEASTEKGLPVVVAGLWLAVGGLALRYGAEFFVGAGRAGRPGARAGQEGWTGEEAAPVKV